MKGRRGQAEMEREIWAAVVVRSRWTQTPGHVRHGAQVKIETCCVYQFLKVSEIIFFSVWMLRWEKRKEWIWEEELKGRFIFWEKCKKRESGIEAWYVDVVWPLWIYALFSLNLNSAACNLHPQPKKPDQLSLDCECVWWKVYVAVTLTPEQPKQGIFLYLP